MGQQSSKVKLSPHLEAKLQEVFEKIDTDKSGTIDKEETLKFWKSNFAKVNTDELFKSVDIDNNGSIEASEWLEFWKEVKRQGHSEEEIEEELQMLEDGFSWVSFGDVHTKKK